MGEENGETEDTAERLFPSRRLLSGIAAAGAYGAVLSVVGTGPSTSVTAHAVRYLAVFSAFYTALSGTNSAVGYLRDGSVHSDTADFAGGLSASVGLGVFYSEVLSAGAGNNVYALLVSSIAISLGMVLITKV